MTRIEQLMHYLKSAPEDCFLKHALALEYVKVAELQTAARLFEENLQQDEYYIATYYHYAALQQQLGDTTKAAALYQQGIAVAKEHGDAKTLNELQAARDLMEEEA